MCFFSTATALSLCLLDHLLHVCVIWMESFPAILKVLQKVCYDGNLELRAVGNFGLMSELVYHTVGTEEKYSFRRVVKVTDKATWCS